VDPLVASEREYWRSQQSKAMKREIAFLAVVEGSSYLLSPIIENERKSSLPLKATSQE